MPHEYLPLERYTVRNRRKSVLDPGYTFADTATMVCPRCEAGMALLDWGSSVQCEDCDLCIERHNFTGSPAPAEIKCSWKEGDYERGE